MKKLLTSLLVIAILLTCSVTVLAACDKRDYDYTITFYTQQNDDLQKVTQNAIDSFEAKYPGWHVDHQIISNGYDGVRDKTIADLSGKKQPDLAYCYADHVSLYMKTGKVIDVMQYINADGKAFYVDSATGETVNTEEVIGYTPEEIANFVPAYYNEGDAINFSDYDKYGFEATSKLMMPFAKSTELMYYNVDALKELGAEVPTTWDELFALKDKVNAKWPTATLLGYDSEANWFITESERQGWGYTSTNNEQHYLFNNKRAADWLDKLGGMRMDITSQGKYKTYTSNLFKLGPEDGGVVFCVGSSGGAKNQNTTKFQVGIARVPGSLVYDKDGKPVMDETTGKQKVDYRCISQGPSLVMLKSDKAKNPEQKALMTWMFIKELYNPGVLASVASLQGYCSPMSNTAELVPDYAKDLANAIGSDGKINNITHAATKFAEELSKDGLLFTSPAFVGSSEARTQVGNALQYVIEGTASGKDALQEAYNNCGGM